MQTYELEDMLIGFCDQLYNRSVDVKNINVNELDNAIGSIPFFNELIEKVAIPSEQQYSDDIKANNLISLRDCMININRLVNENKISGTGLDYKYLFIDEFQDTDDVQIETILGLKRTDNKFFAIKKGFKEEEIDSAIDTLISDITKNVESDKIQNIRKDSIVIHGIHQFTPIMLRMIEELSKYKLVVILFNYQPDYKNVYQTWLDVYSSFEAKIVYSPRNLNNESQMFDGGKIADNIAAIIAGNTGVIDFSKQIEVTQFDNATEFAGYIAKKFEQAESLRKEDSYAHPALYYMNEQFYAANSDVNNILKIYFPEQFGERAFLDYPIGHFFLSVTNMWDPESQVLYLKDFNDLCACVWFSI